MAFLLWIVTFSPNCALQQWFSMYKPITYNTNLLTEEADSFVNKLDPSKVFKSKNKTLIPKKKGPVQPAGSQKGPSGPPSTPKSSSGSGNPVRKWALPPPTPLAPQRWFPRTDVPWVPKSQVLCVEPWASSHLSDQNPRPFTPIGISQEFEGRTQVPQESFPHGPHSTYHSCLQKLWRI